MNKEELFFKEHFKEIKQLADNNNKITLACKYIMLKEELEKIGKTK